MHNHNLIFLMPLWLLFRRFKIFLPVLSSLAASSTAVKTKREPLWVSMCVCAGVWPMWCSDVLISLSLALFLSSLSPGVLKLSDGKFFLGNSYTSYFSFLSHLIFDSALLIFAVIYPDNVDRMVTIKPSGPFFFFLLVMMNTIVLHLNQKISLCTKRF